MKHHMTKWNFVFDGSQRMLLEFLCSSADWFKLSADNSEYIDEQRCSTKLSELYLNLFLEQIWSFSPNSLLECPLKVGWICMQTLQEILMSSSCQFQFPELHYIVAECKTNNCMIVIIWLHNFLHSQGSKMPLSWAARRGNPFQPNTDPFPTEWTFCWVKTWGKDSVSCSILVYSESNEACLILALTV